jgi:hypothetical protein
MIFFNKEMYDKGAIFFLESVFNKLSKNSNYFQVIRLCGFSPPFSSIEVIYDVDKEIRTILIFLKILSISIQIGYFMLEIDDLMNN